MTRYLIARQNHIGTEHTGEVLSGGPSRHPPRWARRPAPDGRARSTSWPRGASPARDTPHCDELPSTDASTNNALSNKFTPDIHPPPASYPPVPDRRIPDARRLARTLGEPAPSPKRRGHRNGVDDTRASWDAVHGMPSSFANSAAPSPIHPLGSAATQHNPPQPETPAGSISGRESAPSWGPTGHGSTYHSPSKKDYKRGQIQTQMFQDKSNASPESGKSARTQDDPHVLSHTHDFDASSGRGDLTRTGSNARVVNDDVNDALDAEPESESGNTSHLRERLRGAEARERLARTALEDAEARSRLDVAERIRVEGTARHLEATVAKFAAQNEEMLAAVKRQTQRAVEAERIAKSSQRDADAASLSDARRLEVAMKAGYLARYVLTPFSLDPYQNPRPNTQSPPKY